MLEKLRDLHLARRALVKERTAARNRQERIGLPLLKPQNRHSIPGISNLAAFALIIDMPEPGTLDQRQVASLAGLARPTRQSGAWSGHAHIRGGRSGGRQALYGPALVAARFNPDLKAKYDQLVAAGKPPQVTLTAVMRKLLLLASVLLRDHRTWTPNLP